MTYEKLENKIVSIQMELTNACPLGDCAECAWRFMTRPIGHMDFELAVKVVDGAVAAFGDGINFNLNGLGEPLSYKPLPDLIRYIGKKSPRGRIEMFSSLVGGREQVADVCRAFNEVPNEVLFATTCHLRSNTGEILSQTVKNFQFNTVFSVLGNNPRIDLHVATNKTIFTTDYDIEMFRDIFGSALPEDKVHVVERLDPWLEFIRPVAVECSDVTSPAVCDYPFRVLHVGWDGTCLICCTDDVEGKLEIGKIETPEDVRTVWHSDFMDDIRKKHNGLDCENMSPCNECGRTKGYIKR